MSLVRGVINRLRDSWNILVWSKEKNSVHTCLVGDKTFSVVSPSLRQLEVMRDVILTDKYLATLRRYFSCLSVTSRATVLDVGANIGYMALIYSAALPDCEIIAFEPSETNYRFLLQNTSNEPRILPQAIGLHHEKSKGVLCMPSVEQNSRIGSANYRNTGLYSMYGKGKQVSSEIELVPLDQWLLSYPKKDKVGFVKIDVEGNELNVLKGATKFLVGFSGPIEIEVNSETMNMSGSTFGPLTAFLKEYSYQAFSFDGENLSAVHQAPKGNQNLVFLKTKVVS